MYFILYHIGPYILFQQEILDSYFKKRFVVYFGMLIQIKLNNKTLFNSEKYGGGLKFDRAKRGLGLR